MYTITTFDTLIVKHKEEMIMNLFSKKNLCPICGSLNSWLLPLKIEDEYICGTCQNKIDIAADKEIYLTMQGLREYIEFYDRNQLLREQFIISERFDFDHWDTKIIFDYRHKMFCMSKKPDKTVFYGKQLKSFTIKEDSIPLFEGSVAGIKRYVSTVPERAKLFAPYIIHFLMKKHQTRATLKSDDDKENQMTTIKCFDVPGPFQTFNVELHFDHPYCTVIKCDIDAPKFSSDNPDLNDYIRSYQCSIERIEKMVVAFKTVAFPSAPEQFISLSQ
ncbi:MAG: hypothetical protein K0S41_257 [Anaerocolumna sp.]|nr:hypothetical protein [Anaerocolumna sp.]